MQQHKRNISILFDFLCSFLFKEMHFCSIFTFLRLLVLVYIHKRQHNCFHYTRKPKHITHTHHVCTRTRTFYIKQKGILITVGGSDIPNFAVFNNRHIAADQVYFCELNFKKSADFDARARDA